jgi:hypothetical protein
MNRLFASSLALLAAALATPRVHAQDAAKPPAAPAPAPAPPAPPPPPAPANPPAPGPASPSAEAPAQDPETPGTDNPAAPEKTPEPETAPPPETAPETAPAPGSAPVAAPEKEKPAYVVEDELEAPGYVPGYRRYESLGLSPYSPRTGAPPGGVTPSFGAPSPSDDWLFTWSGYMSASLQISIDEREDPQRGQKKTVFHAPPIIVEEYASFVSTNSLPGNWIGSNFNYGNSFVTATVQIATWNPTRPTNNLSPGSQYFINDMYLKLKAPPVENFRLTFTAGFFSLNYGGLGRYGGGFYTNTMTGGPTGAGEITNIEYDIDDTWVAVVEHGIMGPRTGTVPMDVIGQTAGSGNNDPIWTGAWTHHAHVGVVKKGDLQLQAQLHYMSSWAQDDRIQREASRGELPEDNPQTDELDESYVRDGRIRVFGADFRAISRPYGVLGVGGSFIDGYHSYPLRGITTFGGDGERLTSSWWGNKTTGTGTLLVGGVAYSMSVASLLLDPEPFSGNAADVQISTGLNLAYGTSDDPVFDGRLRHKYGIDVLYTFLPYVGAGVRFDRVVPSSLDSKQTFHVLAPRLQFKSDWQSHEAIVVSYVKWFLGPETHLDGTQPRTSERIDDEMFTLNFNMWW